MNESICKFNYNTSNDLICSNFIYETTDVIKNEIRNNLYCIGLITSGSGVYEINGQKYPVEVGTVFFKLVETVTAIKGEGIKCFYIQFYGRRAFEYIMRLSINVCNCVFYNNDELIKVWMDYFSKVNKGNIDLLSEAVLLYTLATLNPPAKEENTIISDLIRLTSEMFSDSDFSLSKAAEILGYNSKYLSNVFKKGKGIPFTKYLTETRVNHAVYLIENGVISIKNLAILTGYNDALYFSKVFKKVKGISPTTYIENFNKQM